MTLRQIRLEALYDELYGVVCPDAILADDPSHTRYQSRQTTVRPRRARIAPKRSAATSIPDRFVEPMPLLMA